MAAFNVKKDVQLTEDEKASAFLNTLRIFGVSSSILQRLDQVDGAIFGQFVFMSQLRGISRKKNNLDHYGVVSGKRLDIAVFKKEYIMDIINGQNGFIEIGVTAQMQGRDGTLSNAFCTVFYNQTTNCEICIHEMPYYRSGRLQHLIFSKLALFTMECTYFSKSQVVEGPGIAANLQKRAFSLQPKANRKSLGDWMDVMKRVLILERPDRLNLVFSMDPSGKQAESIGSELARHFAQTKVSTFYVLEQWNKQFGFSDDRTSHIPKFLIAMLPMKKNASTSVKFHPGESSLARLRLYAVSGLNDYKWRCPWSDSLPLSVADSVLQFKPIKEIYVQNKVRSEVVKPESFLLLNLIEFPLISLQGKLPRECVHVASSESEYPLASHIDAACVANLVFFIETTDATPDADKYTATCMDRTRVFANPEIFYECPTVDSMATIWRDIPIALIDIYGVKAFITLTNFRSIELMTEQRYFVARRLPYHAMATAKAEALEPGADWTSADHCQNLSDKQLWIIHPVNPQSVEYIVEQVRPVHMLRDLALKFRDVALNEDNEEDDAKEEETTISQINDDDDDMEGDEEDTDADNEYDSDVLNASMSPVINPLSRFRRANRIRSDIPLEAKSVFEESEEEEEEHKFERDEKTPFDEVQQRQDLLPDFAPDSPPYNPPSRRLRSLSPSGRILHSALRREEAEEEEEDSGEEAMRQHNSHRIFRLSINDEEEDSGNDVIEEAMRQHRAMLARNQEEEEPRPTRRRRPGEFEDEEEEEEQGEDHANLTTPPRPRGRQPPRMPSAPRRRGPRRDE